jgi:two-component system chemotaxis sensor kinase CheA
VLSDPDLIAEFVVESLEHLEAIEPLLLELEKRGATDAASLNEIFRAIHSIKGAAGFLGLENVSALSHAMESLLMRLRDGQCPFRAEMTEPLLRAVDALRVLLRGLPEFQGEPATALVAKLEALRDGHAHPRESSAGDAFAIACEVQRRKGHHVVRVALPARKSERAKLASRLLLFAEVVPEPLGNARSAVVGSPLEPDLLAEALALDPAALELVAAPVAVDIDTPSLLPEDEALATSDQRAETIRVSLALLDKLMNLAGELVLGRNQMRQLLAASKQPGVKEVLQSLDLVTTELQENIMNTRMQPLRVLFDRMPRLVRDMAQRLAKKVELETSGGDVELDRSIIEALSDPMTHMLRNALDHGLEEPQGRAVLGKAETGRVWVRAYHEGGRVVIEVRDDGRGIDPERVKESAIARGAISREQATALSEKAAIQLIFEPGLSTVEEISDLSGRGVGMDVVRTNVQNLGGQIDIVTAIGEGTTLLIHLPLTLAIIPSLIVSVANERFAVPQVNVVEVVRLKSEAEQVERIRSSEVLRLRGNLLPLVRLATCLEIPEPAREKRPRANVVVLRSGSHVYGLVVDELHDNEEIVVKPVSTHLADCGWYAGAAILGDGRVAMILDTIGIAKRAHIHFEQVADELSRRSSAASVPAAPAAQSRSLVVFANTADERFAVPLGDLLRIERVDKSAVEWVGAKPFLRHHGRAIRLVHLEDVLPVGGDSRASDEFFVLIPRLEGLEAGIVATRVVDTLESDAQPDATLLHAPGLLGSAIVEDRLTLFLDTGPLFEAAGIERTRA